MPVDSITKTLFSAPKDALRVPYMDAMSATTLKIPDTRKVDAASNLPVTDRNSRGINASIDLVKRIASSAKSHGIDPYTALAVAHQESEIKSDPANGVNLFGVLGHGFDRNSDPVELGVKTLKDKLEYGKRLGKKTEPELIQAYNGYGKLKYDEKSISHNAPPKKMYGLDVSQGIDFAKNPLYGKRIIDIRDNILKKNPQIVNLVNSL